MSDDEIQVRVHNRDAEPEERPRRSIHIIHLFSGDTDVNELEINPEDDEYPFSLLLPGIQVPLLHILSRSLEQDRQLRKDEKVCILYQKIKTEKELDCVICTETCEIDTEVAQLICDHCFHIKCITEWGKYKQECPMCRKPIEYKIR